jgi:V/A-type H+-transporting ATPase subunit I
MIVPMKKATILFVTGDAEATVTCLRKLGLLHVEHQNPPEGRDISELQDKVALIHSSFDVLNRVTAPEKNIQPQDPITADWTAVADHIIKLGNQLEQRESSSGNIISQINEWEHWGDVDIREIQHLSQNGIYLALYEVPVKEIRSFPDDVVVKTIFTAGDIAHCITISKRRFECPYQEILPPKATVSALKEQLIGNTKDIEMINGEIIKSARFFEALAGIEKTLKKEIEFQQVVSGMGTEGAISYITGYIPYDLEGHLSAEARSRKWGIVIDEPSADDNVPTLLRNPPWVNRIRPVLELLGLTPGYHELDVSMLFLVFFAIFFGILIGDAGYGLVYILLTLLITFWLRKRTKLNPEMKTMFSLFYLLGSCAIIWGVLTGTFFGQEWLRTLGFTPLVPQLNDAGVMQSFCFFLGALHLSIAHSWQAYLKYPSLKALADVGWICVLWTAFFVARTLILGEAFPSWVIWLFAAGIILVIVCTSPQANLFRAIGGGLGTVALSLMNNFTDVISYIRLFAVGLAGLAIAETTNTLSAGFGSGIVALVAGVVILIIGHGLNIILGLMSVLVHGVRLNVLEFSGHANVTWSGFTFEPLKE